MNILIAPTERQGISLIEAFGADRNQWKVIPYGGMLMANKPEVLVIIPPGDVVYGGSEQLKMAVEGWFTEQVPHLRARAGRVVDFT